VPASPVIMLNDLGNQGVTLRGFEDNAFAGSSVASAGDMNGDGFDDVIVGAPQTDAGGVDRGEVYVVFGGPNLGGATLNLNDLGTQGFTLRGFLNNGVLGRSIASAGDVNEDGFDDLVVSEVGTNDLGLQLGKIFVVFGGASLGGTTITPDNLGAGGLTILGITAYSSNPDGGTNPNIDAGASVAGAGDVNGDGFDDVIIGVPTADYISDTGQFGVIGEAYVVFGGNNLAGSSIRLDTLGAGGFKMLSPGLDLAGSVVAGAGECGAVSGNWD